ncbi:MAG: HDIG domain-containing protein [Dehalococcoidia bacterium]|nr:HDIG domain-containing protein [Dehalococcoidia bacterium]
MSNRPVPRVVSRLSAAIFGLLMALATLALVVPLLPLSQDVHEGDIAPRTLSAPRTATFESAAATRAARDLAATRVADVPLPLDQSIRASQADKLDRLLDQVRGLRIRSDLNAAQRLEQIAAIPGAENLSNAGRNALLALDATKYDTLQRSADAALAEIMGKTIQKGDITTRIDEYLGQAGRFPENTTPAEITALREVLKAFVTPTFQVDTAATQRKKDDARANVAPIVKTYSQGQVIVGEGDRITAEAIEALDATGVISPGFDLFDFLGGAVAAIALGVTLAAAVWRFQPFAAQARRRMALTGIAIVAALTVVRVAFPVIAPDTDRHFLLFAVPIATAAMIAAAFGDLAFASVVAIATGLFAAFIGATLPQIAGASFIDSLEPVEFVAAATASGLAGAAAVYRAERLGRYALAAAVASGASFAMMMAIWLISAPHDDLEIAWIALVSSVNGIGSAIIALGVFVILSIALGVTTRLHLMELAQADHPLLRRLQDEAPGTYHHSMMVGALAERGAAQIGADALLARVGSYYHDIGKISRPGHYVENMLEEGVSPHESLTPIESACVIREHIPAGLEIARRYRLPAAIRAFIPEHHGTRLVTYFYRKAVQDAGGAVDASPFRYSGPRPQTRETAIVMLADSCEAIARASDANRDIDSLVDGVFAERLREGQLDECDLTMRELQALAASFKATLTAVYHPRVPYPQPTPEELANLARIAQA